MRGAAGRSPAPDRELAGAGRELSKPTAAMIVVSVGPNCALASCWAREDWVPGTTVIDGESAPATPKPITLRATATTSQAARDAFGRRMENLARDITASPRIRPGSQPHGLPTPDLSGCKSRHRSPYVWPVLLRIRERLGAPVST